MGTVYKAEQRSPMQRIVALKLIKLGFDTTEVIARFESERQALARMDHPGVAKVLDAGADAGGRPYFVMEYVPGVAITQFADDNRLSIPQRLELFSQVCDAIAHAHTKAIIHRDIKSSNVLAYLADGKPVVKVIDFGIAKALTGDRLTDCTFNTARGEAIGTYESMSPEQADGSPDIDTRTDVYALGVLLYELLTGFKPFDRDTFAKAADAEIRRIIREVEPPRPSTRLSTLGATGRKIAAARMAQLDALTKQLRSELEWIPLMAMRKERHRRYASPLELLADIRSYLETRPLRAGPESSGYRLRKYVYRNRAALSAIGTIVTLLIAGILVSTTQWVRAHRAEGDLALQLTEVQRQKVEAEKQKVEADGQRDEAKKQEQIAGAVNQFLLEIVSGADPRKMLGDQVTVVQMMHAALKRLNDGALKDQPLVEAALRDTIGTTLLALFRHEVAEPNRRRSLELRRSALPEGHPDIATSLNNLAVLLQNQRRLPEAEPLYREALQIRRHAMPPQPLKTAESMINLGILLQSQGDLDGAERLFREALDIRYRFLPRGHRDIAGILFNLGSLLRAQGNVSDAERLFRESLDIRRGAFPAGHPDVAIGLGGLAALLRSKQDFADAEKLYREALEIRRQSLPAGHWDIVSSLNDLASTLRAQGKLTDAELLYREALEINRKAVPARHADTASTLNSLALLLKDRAKLTDAKPLYEEALELHRKSLPLDHASIATSLHNLAALLRAQGELNDAEPLYREALDIRRASLPAGNPSMTSSLNSLASLLLARGKLSEVEPLYREVLEIRRKSLPAGHPDIAATLRSLGSVLATQESFEQADEIYAELLKNDPSYYWNWIWSSIIKLARGNMDAYRAGCFELLNRFGDTKDRTTAERVAKLAVTVPGAVEDLSLPLKLTKLAVSGGDHASLCYFEIAHGMALYREGSYVEGEEYFRKSILRSDTYVLCRAQATMFLAMTLWQQDRKQEASLLLKDGLATAQREIPGNAGVTWHEWVLYRFVEQEARTLIDPNSPVTRWR